MGLENVKKGELVFVVETRNRNVAESWREVLSVGRKYVTVACGWRPDRFHIGTGALVTDYTPHAYAYATEQEYRTKLHREAVTRKVRNADRHHLCALSLEDLEAIAALLDKAGGWEP